jgi:uncharacterized protein (TIGR03437 family)
MELGFFSSVTHPVVSFDIYIRFGQPVTVENGQPVADFSVRAVVIKSVYLNTASSPPLQPGTYYAALKFPDEVMFRTFRVSAGLSESNDSPCYFQASGDFLLPRGRSFGYDGGIDFELIETRCNYRVSTDVDWITLTKVEDGGMGILYYTVAPNPDAGPRHGTITIGFTPLRVTQSSRITIVSSASYRLGPLAAGSLVTAFGAGAPVYPGIQVTDVTGQVRYATVYYASNNQINFLLPLGLAHGLATVRFTTAESTFTGLIRVVQAPPGAPPGLFSVDSSGQGLAAALVQRIRIDGSVIWEPVADYDAASGTFTAREIDLEEESDQVFLVLFGTGVHKTSLNNYTALVGNEQVEVLYAGAQPDFAGLDQVNLRLPRSLRGAGEVEIRFTVSNQTANPVKVKIR